MGRYGEIWGDKPTWEPEMRSGDMYAAVPTHEARREKVLASWPDMPKSASFTSPLELRRTFAGLMSRWTTLSTP
mgnify:CR=1 FL=1